MRVVVVGGKLQGVEAAYLARQAGWEVVLVDRDGFAPATGLCDEFCQMAITDNVDKLARLVKTADLIIPAIEDLTVLNCLSRIAGRQNVPLAFDPSSYNISSSKKKSDLLFSSQGINAPKYWPKCNFPVIIKPSDSSGSQGVEKIFSFNHLSDFFREQEGDMANWIIQEFMEGPSYSLEIMGFQGEFITLQTTDLEMDRHYDCKRVWAPTELEPALEHQFRAIAHKIAKAINLTGIMDVEVIKHQGILKVLEIDARLPSQTPTVVYRSTGINMVKMLYDIYVRGQLPENPDNFPGKAVVYEHIRVTREGLETLGEHIMTTGGPLRYYNNLFGADEIITNYEDGRSSWVATLIITGRDRQEVWTKRCAVIQNIASHLDLPVIDE